MHDKLVGKVSNCVTSGFVLETKWDADKLEFLIQVRFLEKQITIKTLLNSNVLVVKFQILH